MIPTRRGAWDYLEGLFPHLTSSARLLMHSHFLTPRATVPAWDESCVPRVHDGSDHEIVAGSRQENLSPRVHGTRSPRFTYLGLRTAPAVRLG